MRVSVSMASFPYARCAGSPKACWTRPHRGGRARHDVKDWPQDSFSGRCRAARVCCAIGAAGHPGSPPYQTGVWGLPPDMVGRHDRVDPVSPFFAIVPGLFPVARCSRNPAEASGEYVRKPVRARGGLSVLLLLVLIPVFPGSIAGLQRHSPLVQIFVGTWILASIFDVLPNADGTRSGRPAQRSASRYLGWRHCQVRQSRPATWAGFWWPCAAWLW